MSTVNAQGQTVLTGDGSYGFTVTVIGDDLKAVGVRATAWGGPSDPYDSGKTACGVDTKRWGDKIIGCSLPQHGAGVSVCEGSPIPKLRYGKVNSDGTPDFSDDDWVFVNIYSPKTGKQVRAVLIDIGPAKPPHAHAGIDLTTGTIRRLGFNCKPDDFDGVVDFRVLGGAKFL